MLKYSNAHVIVLSLGLLYRMKKKKEATATPGAKQCIF